MVFEKKEVVEVVGVVASGKTTLAKKIAEQTGATYIDIDLYLHNPFLIAVSNNRGRYSFITGLSFSYERSKKIPDVKSALKKNSVILDQGFDMGLYTYSTNAYKQQAMTKDEYGFLVRLHKEFMRKAPSINTTVVLNPSTETIQERIEKRGRPHEKKYSADYIEGLRECLRVYINTLRITKSRKSIIICSDKKISTIGLKQKSLVSLIKKNI